jgi:hypothetical protein
MPRDATKDTEGIWSTRMISFRSLSFCHCIGREYQRTRWSWCYCSCTSPPFLRARDQPDFLNGRVNCAVYSSYAGDKTLHVVYTWPWADVINADTMAAKCAMPRSNGTHSCENNELPSVPAFELPPFSCSLPSPAPLHSSHVSSRFV